MRSCTAAIGLQGQLDVFGALTAQLRNTVGRIRVPIPLDAVAAEAGIAERLAAFGVAVGIGRLGEKSTADEQCGGDDCKPGNDIHDNFQNVAERHRIPTPVEAAMLVRKAGDF